MGAFDKIRPEILLLLLSKFGLSQKIIKFINALNSPRHLIGFAADINLQSLQFYSIFTLLSFSVIPNNVNILYYADDLDNKYILFSPSSRFLGIVLDSQLNWKAHINHMKNRLSRINILKLQISRLQFAALRAVSGLMRTIPTNVLLDINGEYSLFKIMARQSHPLNQIISNISKQPDHTELLNQIEHFLLSGYLEFPYNCNLYKPIINTELGSQILSVSDTLNSFIHLIQPLNSTPLIKLMVLRQSLIKVGFAVSSSDVISNLNNPVVTSISHHKIFQIRNSLFEYSRKSLEVHLFWIPSHKSIPGNEKADSLAKESLHLSDPFLFSKCYYTNLYSKFKTLTKNKAVHIIQSEVYLKDQDISSIFTTCFFPRATLILRRI
ncbi:hypothetical protein ACFW04_013576 [Cataglyphis niger]